MALVKSITIDLGVSGDAAAKAKLDAITARADELKKSFPDFTVKIDTAAAAAKLQVFRAQLADAAKPVTVKVNVDTSALTGLRGLLAKVPGIGGLFGGGALGNAAGIGPLAGQAASAAGAAPAAGGVPAGLGLAAGGIGAVAAIGSGAGGIVPLLAAATLGLGSFAALALPTLANLRSSMAAVSAATDKYATASTNLNTAIHQSPADLAAYKSVLKGLEPDLAAAAVLLTNTSVQWQDLTPVQQASATALRNNAAAYKTLLPDQKNALNALLKERDAWNAMTPAQQAASANVQKLKDGFSAMAATLEPLTLQVLNLALTVANHLMPVLLPLATAAGNALQPLLKSFDKFAQSPGFKAFTDNMAKLAGPSILAIGEGLGKVAVAVGKLLIAMESPDALRILNGLFTGLAGAVNVLAWTFTHGTPIMIGWMHKFADGFDALRHATAADVHQISDWIDALRVTWVTTGHALEATWNAVARDFDNFRHRTAVVFDGIRGDIAHYWDMIWNNTVGRVSRGIGDVIAWFQALPGRAVAALGNAGNLLYGWGSGVISGLLQGMQSIIGSVWNFIKGIPGQILSFLGIHSPPQWAIDAGKHIVDGIGIGMSQSKAALAKATAGLVQATTSQFTGGAGVQQWAGLVAQALAMEGLSPSLLGNVLYQMQTESGGNPASINLWDSNAKAGDPSRGLMQVIGSTFQTFHWPGTSWNIYDPLANIAAALNYARFQYGPTLMSGGMGIGSGHGYALGTSSAAAGWGWVGEHGPELLRFRGGEQVIPAGARGGGDTYVTVHVHAPVGSSPREIGQVIAAKLAAFKKAGGMIYKPGGF